MSCFDAKRNGKKPERPPVPSHVLMVMLDHRRTAHGTTDVLAWFDCPACEQIEKAYSESLEWHYDRITREIAGEAKA